VTIMSQEHAVDALGGSCEFPAVVIFDFALQPLIPCNQVREAPTKTGIFIQLTRGNNNTYESHVPPPIYMEGIYIRPFLLSIRGGFMKQNDKNDQKVVPIRHRITVESSTNIQQTGKHIDSRKVEVIEVGKLKFTVYTNTPSQEAMDSFNEHFQGLFERAVANNENDALPA